MIDILKIALTFFLVANPIGNTPALVSIVKNFSFEKQKAILFREAIFSFLIAIVFLFIGGPLLATLQIQSYALSLTGGILLFIVALNMIFPPKATEGGPTHTQEPFIVPIATPLITGGGVLATVMIYAEREQNTPKIFAACVVAWIAVTAVMVSAAYLQRILGTKGLLAMEQLMGMMLSLMSMELIVKGAHLFIGTL